MNYRKKPVVIDAWPMQNILAWAENDWRGLPEPVRAAYERAATYEPVEEAARG